MDLVFAVDVPVAPNPPDRLLFSVRWGLTAALAYLVLFDQSDEAGASELFFVGVLLASNLLARRLERWLSRERAFVVLFGADSALVLLGLLLADSASQDLVIGYFICVLLAAFADSEERLIVLSLVATGLYAFICIQGVENPWQPALLLRFPLLLFVTLSYGLLVTRLRVEQAARIAAERRAVSLETVVALTRDLASTLSTSEILERTRAATARVLTARQSRVVTVGNHDDPMAPLAAEAIAAHAPIIRNGASGVTVAIPLSRGVEALGAIVAELERAEGTLSPDEREYCEIAADAASLALGNAGRYEELTQVERTKSDFLRNLSHEMQTPLHAILGFADIAAASLDDPSRNGLRRALERITTRAQEMAVHIEHLLRLSQLTLGRERAVPTVVDVPEILARSLEDARRAVPQGAVDLHLEVSSDLHRVIIDGEKLGRIVDCLLLNAVKFSERGRIDVAAVIDEGKRLRLSVRDEGIGIAAADRRRIFEDFEQGDGSTTRRFPGLGLGLAVSRRLAELLGGEITVASEAGRGSTFEVVVPVSLPLAA